VVLLDTGGLRRSLEQPSFSWFVRDVYRPDYDQEIGIEVMRKLWETGIDQIARCTFTNPELAPHLQEILQNALATAPAAPQEGSALERVGVSANEASHAPSPNRPLAEPATTPAAAPVIDSLEALWQRWQSKLQESRKL